MNREGNSLKDETARLEESLARLEAELHEQYCQMGKRMLELAEEQQSSVNTLVDDIIETRKKLVVARHEIECPECLTFNLGDSKYCRRCGTCLEPHSEAQQQKESQYETG